MHIGFGVKQVFLYTEVVNRSIMAAAPAQQPTLTVEQARGMAINQDLPCNKKHINAKNAKNKIVAQYDLRWGGTNIKWKGLRIEYSRHKFRRCNKIHFCVCVCVHPNAVVLSEVIQAFSVPENAARMEEARESACNDMGKMLQLVLPVATQIQQEVIKAYGFNNEGEGKGLGVRSEIPRPQAFAWKYHFLEDILVYLCYV